ncbi:hypothetical protein [Pseudomonas sp. TWP3-2]
MNQKLMKRLLLGALLAAALQCQVAMAACDPMAPHHGEQAAKRCLPA